MKNRRIMKSAGMTPAEITRWYVGHWVGRKIARALGGLWGIYGDCRRDTVLRRMYEWASSGVYRRWDVLEDKGFWEE